MKLVLLALLFLTGCADVSTTRFEYSETVGTVTKKLAVIVPKEIKARDLEMHLDFASGRLDLKAKVWESRNVQTILAQGQREEANLVQVGNLTDKAAKGVTEGVVAGAMKGVIP